MVPFESKLAASNDALTALFAPVRDGYVELESFNKMIAESSIILYALD